MTKKVTGMGVRLAWLALLLPAWAAAGDSSPYPRPELLMEPAELAKPEVAKKFHVLDARPWAKYKAGHIPGAFWVDHAAWSAAFNTDPAAESWGKRLGAAGLDRLDRRVVVYADDVREAARVWWILRYWGLKDVRLLNGGWQGWLAAGSATAKWTPVGDGERKTPPLTAHPERLATMKLLLDALKEKRFSILDARSEREYCGDMRLAKRGGSIPGATHLEWSALLDKKTQRFKSAGELRKLFKDAGVDPARPTITYCQSGGRAAVLAFGLELMGAKGVRNYYRSWSEWGNAEDTPVATPKKK
jgi:thiosulfate/3-mercaptopyruvate sulfurtransferase